MAQLDHHRLHLAVQELRALGRAVRSPELRLKLLEMERLILTLDSMACVDSRAGATRRAIAVAR